MNEPESVPSTQVDPTRAYQENLKAGGLLSMVTAYPLVGENRQPDGTAWKALVMSATEYLATLDQINAALCAEYDLRGRQIGSMGVRRPPFQPLQKITWEHVNDDPRIHFALTPLEALGGAVQNHFAA